jgi:predicted RNA-binding protein with PIN domain
VPYLVDGHNLIGRFSGLSLSDPEDERQLLGLLRRVASRTRRRIVVFFDRGNSLSSPRSPAGIEVHFVRPPRQADDALLDYLSRFPDPGNWTVVTSDGAVARHAAARGAHIMASERFAQWVRKALRREGKSEAPEEAPEEIDQWIELFGGDPNGGGE